MGKAYLLTKKSVLSLEIWDVLFYNVLRRETLGGYAVSGFAHMAFGRW